MIQTYVTVIGPAGARMTKFTVDTGASTSVIPIQMAEVLGLPQVGTSSVMTANGPIAMPIYNAVIQVENGAPIQAQIVGLRENIHLLGLSELQQLGLVLDPGGTNMIGGVMV